MSARVTTIRLLFIAPLLGMSFIAASPALAAPAAPTIYNCDALDKMNLKSNAKAYSEAVEQCVRRGWEPPPSWKVNDGVNPGIRAGGSGGISNNAVTAPEATGDTRSSKASVSQDKMKYSCDFPPRIKLGFPPKIDIPKGSCWDFFAGLMKDEKGAAIAPSPPAPGVDHGACPIDNDTTGAFGARAALGKGAPSLPCGGMIPLTSTDVVLNANPVGLATTVEGEYVIWIYRKSGSSYNPVATAAKLPTHLCTIHTIGETGLVYRQKTVDLTPPVGQMITYAADAGHLSIRLQSRENMRDDFIPTYTDGEPERYLIIPLAADGTPQIPSDCDEAEPHFQTLSSRQDMLIESSTMLSCVPEQSNHPVVSNDVQISCANDGTFDAKTAKCTDINGASTPATVTNQWKSTCPDGSDAVDGKCPAKDPQLAPASCPAGSASKNVNANCSTTSFLLDGSTNASCAGQTQFSLLDRPNLYYLPNSRPTISTIAGRSAYMVDTVAGSRFYTQQQTSIYLQSTAPAITLNEGGMIRFTNGTTILMDALAVVDVANKKITLTKGGQLLGPNGDQISPFAEGATYTIPSDFYVLPLEVKVERSLTLPAGYSIPTMVKTGALVPYVQLPAAAPPK